MNDYSRKLGLEKGSFTAIADSLVKKGLVRRDEYSGDRRKHALMMTKEGRELADRLNAFYIDAIEDRLSVLNQEDLEALERSLETITSIFNTITEKRE
jgi:DNA-binding MarR family transcriptional regulator